ncbi:MAG: ABC transporter permease [Nitriliruptorales bacterium]|nr:ABC transporter permease [Nitriliruptorales bacterium]
MTPTAPNISRWASLRRRMEHALRPWRRANPMARRLVVVGLLITGFFGFLAVFPNAVAPYAEDQYRFVEGTTDDPLTVDADCAEVECPQIPRRIEPTEGHPFGTTADRFDVFSRVIHGARVAFAIVLLSTALAMGIGVPLGLFSGYRGGKLDRALVTLMDAVYVIPGLLLAIIVAFVLQRYFDPGLASAAVAVGVVYIPQYYRVIRNHTLSVKEEPFVEAARSIGAKPRTVITRYVFFNVVQSVPVIFTLNAADAVLTLAGLGFLGYGVPFPEAEWGLDVSRALSDVVSGFWWTAFFPGVAIMLLVTGLTLVGEGLNDIINPLLRVRGYKGKVPDRDEPAPEADATQDEHVTVGSRRETR